MKTPRNKQIKDSDGNDAYMGNGLLKQIKEYPTIVPENDIQKNYELIEQALNDLTWTVNSASTNTYSTSSGFLSEPLGIVTYRDLNNSYSDYCKEEKEKEQKERVDNIMNKYGLI